MWEFIQYITAYLIEQGGIFGLLLALSIAYIGAREWYALKKRHAKEIEDTKPEKSEITEIKEFTITIKNKQETLLENLKKQSEKLNDLNRKVQNLLNLTEGFAELEKENNERIEKLTGQLQDVNSERIDELKELLESYHKLMHDLSLTLEKIRFVLKTKLNGD